MTRGGEPEVPGWKMRKTEAQTEEESANASLRPDAFVEAFEKAMDDDFNTADAMAAVFELVKFINTSADENSSKEYLQNLSGAACGR